MRVGRTVIRYREHDECLVFEFNRQLHYFSLDTGSVHFAALFVSRYGEGMAGFVFGDAIKT
jgi:hypothetical protein